jgi:chromosome segregation ATPase
MKQCLEEDKFRAKEISDAKDAFKRATNAHASCSSSLKKAEAELPELKNTHKRYSTELARARKQRADDHAQYKKRQADFREAIAFLEDFIKFVRKALKGHFKAFSLVEYSEKLLAHSAKIGLVKMAVPALVAIAEATFSEEPKESDYEYKPNEALASKLNNLLTDLLKRLKADNEQNEKDEAKSLSLFKQYESKLLAVISTLEKNIARVEKQIRDMNACVKNELKIINTAGRKLNRNQGLKTAADSMCKSFNKEFIHATQVRKDEIKTMQDVIKIVQKRISDVPADFIDYIESVKKGFKQYVNSTEFKKFIKYNQVVFTDNVKGKTLSTTAALK